MTYVLIYWLVAHANSGISTATLDGFRNVYACEQAIAQMRQAVPKRATLTAVCINKDAHETHWKGRSIEPGTGKIGGKK